MKQPKLGPLCRETFCKGTSIQGPGCVPRLIYPSKRRKFRPSTNFS
jgi:hypothetical protein